MTSNLRVRLRAFRRLALAAPVTFVAWAWAATASIALAPWPGARVRQQGHAFRFWCRALCRIFGVRVRAAGTPPRPPFFLVANHLSYVDILVLGTELRCVFVAKAEIDDWPLFGALCRSVNTIFIDRQAKRDLPAILARIETTLGAGQGVVIFPEGTSSAGHEVPPFRSALLDLPARMGHAVHWATISYRVPAGATPPHLSVAWWGDMPLVPHLREFLALPWIEAPLVFGAEPCRDDDRKRLAERLRAAVAAGFEPIVTREEVARLEALRVSDPAALPPPLGAGRPR
ncbi:MAG: 1-acyl-sn-glycerol-3-phosphate acyltransferase [Thermoanaerobaculia bacterium]|nr:1-acyl-sn-glycerol-3-phosphate acyltransferase [Thermoanaerobaculia bacterium]